ncbi:MAG: 1-deoxy-D-xylulose-5-phosphate reductoisomerase [Planctomycetota bacterium]|jgi:1-deoxy-D-xylulose-5-phosphate reductoisomerase|nr:1-deoxy-D-xylulose-5-phosphate reductoisomerase [Planctomycetota bacterium]
MKRIAILGCTGSVGVNALRLIDERREAFTVVALGANQSKEQLQQQIHDFRPEAACLVSGGLEAADIPSGTAVFSGADGLLEALDATQPELLLNAITGAAGLPASEWALRNGIPLALANKESLVMAGSYLMELAATTNTPILPVDSEHCAIYQCLQGEDPAKIRRIWLTGSGGPFRERDPRTFAQITPDEALRHPTWEMGPRITIGSATMMNKAFEILEARWLFGIAREQIEVVIHPQSIVHSMVEFIDGSIMAQMGVPDMRVPILYCLSHPERSPFDFEPFDPIKFRELTFEAVDPERFPAIALAQQALTAGGDSGAVLNAADEVATGLFLEGKIDFPSITRTVSEILDRHETRPITCLEDVLEADRKAREEALTAAC